VLERVGHAIVQCLDELRAGECFFLQILFIFIQFLKIIHGF
jgi:hypothetical protein